MTEADWVSCTDPDVMLVFLQSQGRLSPRKARLFAVAACRRIGHLYTDDGSFAAIELAEANAETVVVHDEAERHWVRRCCRMVAACSLSRTQTGPFSAEEEVRWRAAFEAERAAQSPLLRCLFPFTPVESIRVPSSPIVFIDGLLTRLAEAAYEDRMLPTGTLIRSRLLILADALEECGCTNSVILSHLRETEIHIRGCWAVDLVLGKE